MVRHFNRNSECYPNTILYTISKNKHNASNVLNYRQTRNLRCNDLLSSSFSSSLLAHLFPKNETKRNETKKQTKKNNFLEIWCKSMVWQNGKEKMENQKFQKKKKKIVKMLDDSLKFVQRNSFFSRSCTVLDKLKFIRYQRIAYKSLRRRQNRTAWNSFVRSFVRPFPCSFYAWSRRIWVKVWFGFILFGLSECHTILFPSLRSNSSLEIFRFNYSKMDGKNEKLWKEL